MTLYPQCWNCYGKEYCQYISCPMVREKLIELGHLTQRKETMNDIVTNEAVPAEAASVKHFIVDPTTGEEVEVTDEVVGTVTSEGEVGEVTVH